MAFELLLSLWFYTRNWPPYLFTAKTNALLRGQSHCTESEIVLYLGEYYSKVLFTFRTINQF